MSKEAIANFVKALQCFPAQPRIFNPWRDVDSAYDLGYQSPQIRSRQLQRYLEERTGHARVALVAEGLGYRGGHFSGIAMTSERMLLGHLVKNGIHADDIIHGGGQRTSQVTRKTPLEGMTEPTATVVWGALKSAGINTRHAVLWNAFAMHPFIGPDSPLTNRRPTVGELELGRPLLRQFLALFPGITTLAVGDVADDELKLVDVAAAAKLRHPSFGGADLFRTDFVEAMAKVFRSESPSTFSRVATREGP